MKLKKYGGTESKALALAKPVADELGLIIWDIRFEKEGASWYLRIFIDKEGGVTIEDCEALSRPVNKLLDETDPIEQSYFFEVGSCGTQRGLFREEHFSAYIGKEVALRLIRPRDGRRDFSGILTALSREAFTIDENGAEVTFAFTDTAFVNAAGDDATQTIKEYGDEQGIF